MTDTEETVRFITDEGVEYMVAFIEDNNLGIDNAYQLVISNISKTNTKGVDVKIEQTIAAIVNSFFTIIGIYCYLYATHLTIIRRPAVENSLHGFKNMLIKITSSWKLKLSKWKRMLISYQLSIVRQ